MMRSQRFNGCGKTRINIGTQNYSKTCSTHKSHLTPASRARTRAHGTAEPQPSHSRASRTTRHASPVRKVCSHGDDASACRLHPQPRRSASLAETCMQRQPAQSAELLLLLALDVWQTRRLAAAKYRMVSPSREPLTHQLASRADPRAAYALEARIRPTISPYNPSASAKMRMSTIPTKSLGCSAEARVRQSPTMPIASPADSPLNPHASPPPKCATAELPRYDAAHGVHSPFSAAVGRGGAGRWTRPSRREDTACRHGKASGALGT